MKPQKHGMWKTPEFKVWLSMRARCLCKTHKQYAAYGGRGISVCERWMDAFENFYADMGPRPSCQYSIDRINNDGNYEPDNCRWATRKQQQRNTRTVRPLTHDGLTLCVSEWAERLGINNRTILTRLRRGWPIGLALSQRNWKLKH